MQKLHVVIAGASGAVGEGLVIYFLSKGHRVTAIVRQEAKKESLETTIQEEKLENAQVAFIVNAYRTEAEIYALTQKVKASGTVDIALASLGGWYHGPELYNTPLPDWEAVLANNLTSHFNYSKAIVPVLEEQGKGMYVMINGGAAEYAVPHSGAISVMAAAQKMMGQVLQAELKSKNVHVYGVGAFALVRTRERADAANLWLGPEEIAQYTLDLAAHQGEKGLQYWHGLAHPRDLMI